MDKVKANRTWQGPIFLPCRQIPGGRSLRGSPEPGGQPCRKPQVCPVRALAWSAHYNAEGLNYTVCEPVFTEVYPSILIWGVRASTPNSCHSGPPPSAQSGRATAMDVSYSPETQPEGGGPHPPAHVTSTTQHFSNSPSKAPLTEGRSERVPGSRKGTTASVKSSSI